MTAEQLLKKNKLTLDDREKINFVATLEMRLMKHLIGKEDVRVRDYLIAIRILWPNMSETPINVNLIKRAIAYLEGKGWHMNLVEDHSDKIGRYITRTR
jgi:hypothetical protein